MNSLEDYTDGERDVDGREAWFPTGSQELYGEQTLRQVAAQSAKVTATLDAASSVPVRITRNRCRPGPTRSARPCRRPATIGPGIAAYRVRGALRRVDDDQTDAYLGCGTTHTFGIIL